MMVLVFRVCRSADHGNELPPEYWSWCRVLRDDTGMTKTSGQNKLCHSMLCYDSY
jgi:hypothetical protein